MANQEHLDVLKQGVAVWNKWREEHPNIQPDLNQAVLNGLDLSRYNFSNVQLVGAFLHQAKLIEANLSSTTGTSTVFSEADLSMANLSCSNFSRANFSRANLYHVNLQYTYLFGTMLKQANLNEAKLDEALLSEADLSFASLVTATLTKANLTRANLSYTWLTNADLSNAILASAYFANANLPGVYLCHAILVGANFTDADLYAAHLDNANLERAIFVGTRLKKADLSNCFIHGISSWNVQLEEATQRNLIITRRNEPKITVDSLEVAQFIYLLLNNQKIRDVINTITSKVVLILGRFTDERKLVLDALRDELHKHNYSPVVFDFDPSAKRDLTETISTLAHMSRFIIADLTDAKSLPQELQAIVPNLPSVPVQPILHIDGREYAMFEHFKRYSWVLETYRYQDIPTMLASLNENIIEPAEKKAIELEGRR
ncbi:pentapeptide repeat-containing protein [Ktedonobacteria bacterium brp13]|nr:pentapeptide repeat-containing protein [Ktedonobacteria bacterium brp13]